MNSSIVEADMKLRVEDTTEDNRVRFDGSLITMTGIVKHFPGVLALDHVDFDLRAGEVHALLGANGAGKSTLIKILAGVYHKDSGEILLRGELSEIANPGQAQQLGIATIYQEYNLVPELSVAENIFLGHLPRARKHLRSLVVDRRKMVAKAAKLLKELEVEIDPSTPLRRLGVAKQQMVEIAKALSLDSEIYIMDEPTAALSSKEIKELFLVVKQLKGRGCSVIYISHRLEEVGEIADRVTVMRDGRKVDTVLVKDAPTDRLVKMMVGRSVTHGNPRPVYQGKAIALHVEGLTRNGVFKDVNLDLGEGEIVGLAGVMGAGRTEVVRAIFGADPVDGGKVYISGKQVRIKSPMHAVRKGIAYLPEDRKGLGPILSSSVRDNIILASLARFSRLRLHNRTILLDNRQIRKEVMELIKSLNIKTTGVQQLVDTLSGGNQQKIVVARWLCSSARIFLFDEPTRGIDVGAKSEIYGLVRALADERAGVLIISSEVEELVDVCDRVYVLRQGRIVGELDRNQISKEAILALALTGTVDRNSSRRQTQE